METTDCALVLFCKRAEQSKRRLAEVIGRGPATELAGHLLGCALEDLAAWPGAVVVSPAETGDESWAAGLLERPSSVVVQAPGNLGERLEHIDTRLREQGHAKLLFIGIDAPTLTRKDLLAAAATLGEADAVIGEAEDGGVVFMGSAVPWPALAGLPWSTERLGAMLLEHCHAAGLDVRVLGEWQDVDRPGDLRGLGHALATDGRPARQSLLGWLAVQIGERNGIVAED